MELLNLNNSAFPQSPYQHCSAPEFLLQRQPAYTNERYDGMDLQKSFSEPRFSDCVQLFSRYTVLQI